MIGINALEQLINQDKIQWCRNDSDTLCLWVSTINGCVCEVSCCVDVRKKQYIVVNGMGIEISLEQQHRLCLAIHNSVARQNDTNGQNILNQFIKEVNGN